MERYCLEVRMIKVDESGNEIEVVNARSSMASDSWDSVYSTFDLLNGDMDVEFSEPFEDELLTNRWPNQE